MTYQHRQPYQPPRDPSQAEIESARIASALPPGLGVAEERAILSRAAKDIEAIAARHPSRSNFFGDRPWVLTIAVILVIVAIASVVVPLIYTGTWRPF